MNNYHILNNNNLIIASFLFSFEKNIVLRVLKDAYPSYGYKEGFGIGKVGDIFQEEIKHHQPYNERGD